MWLSNTYKVVVYTTISKLASNDYLLIRARGRGKLSKQYAKIQNWHSPKGDQQNRAKYYLIFIIIINLYIFIAMNKRLE